MQDRPSVGLGRPSIVERTGRRERSYDSSSRLLMDRILFLGTPIDDDVPNIVIAQPLFLDGDNPSEEISPYLNCPGGDVSKVALTSR